MNVSPDSRGRDRDTLNCASPGAERSDANMNVAPDSRGRDRDRIELRVPRGRAAWCKHKLSRLTPGARQNQCQIAASYRHPPCFRAGLFARRHITTASSPARRQASVLRTSAYVDAVTRRCYARRKLLMETYVVDRNGIADSCKPNPSALRRASNCDFWSCPSEALASGHAMMKLRIPRGRAHRRKHECPA